MKNSIAAVLVLSVILYFGITRKRYPILLPNGERGILVHTKFFLDDESIRDEKEPLVCKEAGEKEWHYWSCWDPDMFMARTTNKVDTVFFDGAVRFVSYAKICTE